MEGFWTEGVHGDVGNSRPQRQNNQVVNGKKDLDEIANRKMELPGYLTVHKTAQLVEDGCFEIKSDEVVMRRVTADDIIEENELPGEDEYLGDDNHQRNMGSRNLVPVISSINALKFKHPYITNQLEFNKLPEETQRFYMRQGFAVAGIAHTPVEEGEGGTHQEAGLTMLSIAINGTKALFQNDEYLSGGDWGVADVMYLADGVGPKWRRKGEHPGKVPFVVRKLNFKNVISYESCMDVFKCLKEFGGAPGLINPPLRMKFKSVEVTGLYAGQRLPGKDMNDDFGNTELPILLDPCNKDELINATKQWLNSQDTASVRNLINALRLPDTEYTPEGFAGLWLKNKLKMQSRFFLNAKTEAEKQSATTENMAEALIHLSKVIQSPGFPRMFKLEIAQYFLAYQEVHKRIVGKANSANGAGRRVDFQIGLPVL